MKQLTNIEKQLYRFLDTNLEHILAFSLALIYIWFGGLKLIDMSPATTLLYQTLDIFKQDGMVFTLGVFEVLLGISFLIPKLNRISYPIFLGHMLGTFLPFITIFSTVSEGRLFDLTLEGQYIVKNLALIACATAVWIIRKKKNEV